MRPSRLALLALTLLGCACSSRRRAALPEAHGAPVVVISIDTLRADHLPAYGYRGVVTPHLDALRADSVLFANAYSQVPLTLPSHATLLTGLLPAQHGVRDNLGFRLRPDVETLPELLKRNGYATGGAVSSIVLAGESGMKDGFDLYDDVIETTAPTVGLGRVQRAGDLSADLLKAWIASQAGRPFFAFLHLYEPHTPYEPPEPWKSRYKAQPYDGEIARSDEIVGGFLAFLKERGLYQTALIIVVSDHGEGLGEHDEDEHGVFLYRTTLHVPLLVKLPGNAGAGERVEDPVGLLDVPPTVAAVVLPAATLPLPGVPLTRFLGETRPAVRRIFSETVFPRLHYGWSDLASLVDDRHHYIEAPRPELYDLVADPAERRDLAAGLPPAFRSMRIEASKLRSGAVEAPKSADPEHAAKLASLGYLGSSAAGADATDLADPKDKAQTVRAMKQGFALLTGGKPDEAAEAFRKLLASEPKMADVWNGLAQAEKQAGRLDQALEALKETAKLTPGSTDHFLAIASLAMDAGKLDDARAHAELALAGGSTLAHESLAAVAILAEDWATAEKEIAEAALRHPERRFPRILSARVLVKRGKVGEALALLDEVLASGAAKKQQPIMTVLQLRGDALARLGRTAEAAGAFEEEIRLFPGNLEAYQSLALLYASEGSAGRMYDTLDRMLAASPGRPAKLAAAKVLDLVGDRRGASALRRGQPIPARLSFS